jgi:hypothetical protein
MHSRRNNPMSHADHKTMVDCRMCPVWGGFALEALKGTPERAAACALLADTHDQSHADLAKHFLGLYNYTVSTLIRDAMLVSGVFTPIRKVDIKTLPAMRRAATEQLRLAESSDAQIDAFPEHRETKKLRLDYMADAHRAAANAAMLWEHGEVEAASVTIGYAAAQAAEVIKLNPRKILAMLKRALPKAPSDKPKAKRRKGPAVDARQTGLFGDDFGQSRQGNPAEARRSGGSLRSIFGPPSRFQNPDTTGIFTPTPISKMLMQREGYD